MITEALSGPQVDLSSGQDPHYQAKVPLDIMIRGQARLQAPLPIRRV